MALLLGTDISEKITELIRGKVVRVGGAVNELNIYDRCRISQVDDINLLEAAFGVLSLRSAKDARKIYKFFKKFVRQEILWFFKRNAIPRDRKTIILDAHYAHTREEMKGRYDCAISSNVIEHSPNPIFLLLNLYFLVRKGGYQYHVLPHYRYTYDVYRKPSSLDHLIEDFERNTDETDTSHNEDYIQSAIEKQGYMREFYKTHPVSHPYIHYHVFDEHNVRELFEMMFVYVTVDVLKDDRYAGAVVLFKNELNSVFVERFRSVIGRYSEKFLEET